MRTALKLILTFLLLFVNVIATFAGCYDETVKAGKAAFNSGKYNYARQCFVSAKQCPDAPSNANSICNEWIRKIDIKLKPVDNTEAYYKKDLEKGEQLFDNEQYADAKSHFQTMLSKYPKHKTDINQWIKRCDRMLPQTISCSGCVTDTYGIPLVGVSVIHESTNRAVSTDIDGQFTIEAVDNDILRFEYVGYGNKRFYAQSNMGTIQLEKTQTSNSSSSSSSTLSGLSFSSDIDFVNDWMATLRNQVDVIESSFADNGMSIEFSVMWNEDKSQITQIYEVRDYDIFDIINLDNSREGTISGFITGGFSEDPTGKQTEKMILQMKRYGVSLANLFICNGQEKITEPIYGSDLEKAYESNSQGNTSSTSRVSSNNYANNHEYVDLGLSVKWATCNVGADSPSDYGWYFSWGEFLMKFEYTHDNCQTEGLNLSDISGNSSYDAATANWKGNWRLPTNQECQELIDRCTWTKTTLDGVPVYQVTGPSGRSIYLPLGGYYDGSELSSKDDFGYYLTSNQDSDNLKNAYFLGIGTFGGNETYSSVRYYGRNVRAVID